MKSLVRSTHQPHPAGTGSHLALHQAQEGGDGDRRAPVHLGVRQQLHPGIAERRGQQSGVVVGTDQDGPLPRGQARTQERDGRGNQLLVGAVVERIMRKTPHAGHIPTGWHAMRTLSP